MKHLTPDDIIGAAEGTPAPGAREHLLECGRCSEEVTRAAAMLGELREDDVPEPSPLFWEHFSRRVREEIEASPVPAGKRRAWRWLWVPAGALLATIVVAVNVSVRAPRETPAAAAPPPASELAPRETSEAADANWAIVAESADGFDWEETGSAGFVVRPGAAERAVMQLSDEQREELARLLREEIGALWPGV